MSDGHWIRKKLGSWIIAVPPEVRKLLGVTHRTRLHWHLSRKGEAVLASGRARKEGHPPIRQLTRELATAHAEIKAIRDRDALRDRGQYAEGYAHGYLKAYSLLMMGDGAAVEAGERARRFFQAFPDAASLTLPKQVGPRPAPSKPRPNARRRRAQRVEVARAPILGPEDSPPPTFDPFPSSGGAVASGAASPQATHA